jgi:hypothetical protein
MVSRKMPDDASTDDPLRDVTHETFDPAIGSTFRVPEHPIGPASQLTLVLSAVVKPAVDAFHLETRRQRGIRLTPFNLHFRGPREPRLAQGTLALEHPEIGRFDVFLVPIGGDADGWIYEAVFN